MAKKFCLDCKEIVKTKRETQGSIIIELLLWCLFIVPGLIYSIWRSTSRYDVCGICKSKRIISKNHKRAREIIEDQM